MKFLEHQKSQLNSVVKCLFDLVKENFQKDKFGTMVCLDVRADGEGFSSLFS